MALRSEGGATHRTPMRMAVRKPFGAPNLQFARVVRKAIVRAINKRPRTFGDLLRDLPSIYPTDVLAEMDRLSGLAGVDGETLARIRADATAPSSRRTVASSLLPLPHPLDFEWRFSDGTSRELLWAASEMTRKGDTILLYGTPGLAYAAISVPLRNRRVLFVGSENAVSRRLVSLNQAAGTPISTMVGESMPSECAAMVLVDPPWYPDYLYPMLRAAVRACCSDGVVLASLPPVGTRPEAVHERDALERFTEGEGLDRVNVEGLTITYETPFFEENALAAVGINAPAVWRRGDPVAYKRRSLLLDERSYPASYCAPWREVAIDGMRLRVHMDAEAVPDKEGLKSLVEGDVLPSVSRRDPRRAKANVWTSGNRIFRTGNAALTLQAARACSSEVMDGVAPSLWRDVEEAKALAELMDRLRAIASVEADERAHLAWGSHVRFGRVA